MTRRVKPRGTHAHSAIVNMAELAVLLAVVLHVAAAPTTCRLSNVFGHHMVLQRPPQTAMVWGFAVPGTTVKTLLNASAPLLSTHADATGLWRQTLAAGTTTPSGFGQTISFACSTGEQFALNDVLFGDVSERSLLLTGNVERLRLRWTVVEWTAICVQAT